MASTKTKRPPVPEAAALRQLERQVSKTKPELQPEIRAALRRGLEAGGHFEHALYMLKAAETTIKGVDPEAALTYLAYALEDLAALVASIHDAAGPRVGPLTGRA